jgi:thioesterase domain-containing protein/aryl carrier-like protein
MTTVEVPEREVESILTSILAELLGTDVEPGDDFFEIGGDSLLVADYLTEARRRGLQFQAGDVYEHPTAAGLTELLRSGGAAAPAAAVASLAMSTDELWRTHLPPLHPDAPSCLVPLVEGDAREPLFVFHWGNGAVRFTAEVVRGWVAGRPAYGFEAVGYRGRVCPLVTISDMAERYLSELVRVQPAGPYHLAGVCQGSVVAVELGRRLRDRGQEVRLLAMVKPATLDPFVSRGWGLDEINRFRIDSLRAKFGLAAGDTLEQVYARLRAEGWYEDTVAPADLPRLQLVWSGLAFSLHQFVARPYDGPVILFQDRDVADPMARNWAPVLGDLTTHWFEYGVESALPVLNDPLVAEVIRGRLT